MKEKLMITGLGVLFWVVLGSTILFTVVLPKPEERGLIYFIPVKMETAEGIKRGSTVQILGVDKGFVNYLHYSQTDGNGNLIPYEHTEDAKPAGQVVIAVLNFKEPVQIFSDYEVRTKYEALISEKVIDLLPGDSGEEVNYAYWNRTDQLRFMQTGKMPPVGGTMLKAGNYDDPLTIIANVIHENRPEIRRIAQNLRQATDKINTGNGTVALLINRAQIVRGAEDTLTEMSLLVRESRDAAEALRESRAPVDFLSAYIFTLLRLAAGQPL